MTTEMTAFRDSSVIIIDTDRSVIKAGLGLHELLREPTVDIPARVGLRVSPHSVGVVLNGDANEDTHMNGTVPSTVTDETHYKVSDYLVGQALDEALQAGEDIRLYWPFETGRVTDWTQAEALYKHVLFGRLGLRRSQNESPVLLTVPSSLSRRTHERLTHLFFERFNVAGFSIIERPLTQLFAANGVTGVVIDIGKRATEVTAIVDSQIDHNSRRILHVGFEDCERHLANLLRSNQSVMRAISSGEGPSSLQTQNNALMDIAAHIWKQGLVKVPLDGEQPPPQEEEGITDLAAILVAGKEKAVIESGQKKKASAKANAAERERAREIEALDLIQTQWNNQTLTLGKERHRFCEPLFDPNLQATLRGNDASGVVSLQEAFHLVLRSINVDHRIKVCDAVFVTGEVSTPVKGIGAALQSYISTYMLSNPDVMTDVQPKSVRITRVPEYFANFRDKGDSLASFLGSCIVAKTLFSDPANQAFVSKSDYGKIGPRAVVDLAPTML